MLSPSAALGGPLLGLFSWYYFHIYCLRTVTVSIFVYLYMYVVLFTKYIYLLINICDVSKLAQIFSRRFPVALHRNL